MLLLVCKSETGVLGVVSRRSHQRLQALGGAGGSHHDGAVVVGGLEGFLVFLRPDETQHGFVQELILLLQNSDL